MHGVCGAPASAQSSHMTQQLSDHPTKHPYSVGGFWWWFPPVAAAVTATATAAILVSLVVKPDVWGMRWLSDASRFSLGTVYGLTLTAIGVWCVGAIRSRQGRPIDGGSASLAVFMVFLTWLVGIFQFLYTLIGWRGDLVGETVVIGALVVLLTTSVGYPAALVSPDDGPSSDEDDDLSNLESRAARLWEEVEEKLLFLGTGACRPVATQITARIVELCQPRNELDVIMMLYLPTGGLPSGLVSTHINGPDGPELSPRMVFRINRVLLEIQTLARWYWEHHTEKTDAHNSHWRYSLALAESLMGQGVDLDRFSIEECENRLGELVPPLLAALRDTTDEDATNGLLRLFRLRPEDKAFLLAEGDTENVFIVDRILVWAALNEISRRAVLGDGGELFIGESAFRCAEGLDDLAEVESVRLALCEENLGPVFVMAPEELRASVDGRPYNAYTTSLSWDWENWGYPLSQID